MLRASMCLAALMASSAACDEGGGLVTQPDLGPRVLLPLQAGEVFVYRATLRREEDANFRQAAYRLEAEILNVEDNLDQAPARLTLQATGRSLDAGGGPAWRAVVDDFDTWVGRMGPTLPNESVDPAAVSVTLDGAPEIPPPPAVGMPKDLPQLGPFFIDVRRFDAVATAWSNQAEDADRSASGTGRLPMDGAPDRAFQLRSSGPAPLGYHDTPQRTVTLVYDADGALFEVSEEVGGEQTRTVTQLFLEERR